MQNIRTDKIIVKAFAPGNVSCIFRIIENKDKSKRHSLGLGFTVDKGVIVKVSKNEGIKIYANGKKISFPTVKTVIEELVGSGVKVEITDQLPSGAGFGISGASALATSYALNKLFNLGKSKKQLTLVAHYAEVINGTGLGDVGGQYHGGVCAKYKKGSPLSGVSFNVKDSFVYYTVFGGMDTKKVINDKLKKIKINRAGDRALKRIKLLKDKNFKDIIRISKDFSVESGLLNDKRVKNLISYIEDKGGNASMIMLGNAVFSDIPFKNCKKVKISRKGACLL